MRTQTHTHSVLMGSGWRNATSEAFLRHDGVLLGIMGLSLASCGAGVSSAHSLISAGAAAASHPGRRADGLMCGEMSREQSVTACVTSSLLSVYLSPSFSSPSLHLLHLSLFPPFPSCISFPPPWRSCPGAAESAG